MTPRQRAFLAFAFFTGAGLWVLVGALTGKREAWDSTFYWRYLMPVACLVPAALAWFEPRRWLVLGVAPFAGQFVAMLATAGLGSLAPLDLVFMAVLSLPAVLLSFAAAALSRRNRPPE